MGPQNQLSALWDALSSLNSRLGRVESSGIGDLSGDPRSDVGSISNYLQDVYNLAPEVVRTEHLRFELRIVNQQVVFETPSLKIDPEFAFALRRLRITGWCSDPTAINFANPSVTFQLEDQGRARGGIFQSPISIVETANHLGVVASELVWDSLYRFVPGADIRGIWGVDLATMPQEASVTFMAGITGDVLRTRTLPGGAMITTPFGKAR